MKSPVLALVLLIAMAGCGSHAPDAGGGPSDGAVRKHRIPGIAQMNLAELSRWVERCAPYNATPEGRARNPYEPADCDDVQWRHDSWRTPQTQKPAAYLPGLH